LVAVQYADPAVSRAKFDREVGEYRALEADYRARGWLLLQAEFPLFEVAMAAPQLKPPAMVTGVRLDYTNYDASPPSVRLVNPFTGVPYLFKDLPTALKRSIPGIAFALPGLPAGQQMMVNQQVPLMQANTGDEIPFLCLAGVREYHDHPAHSGDGWELHRRTGAGRIVRLLELIHKYGSQPLIGYAVQLVPQIAGFDSAEPPQ
jgi:putative metal binding uncharacterized protein